MSFYDRPPPKLHTEVLDYYQTKYNYQIANGTKTPITLQIFFFPLIFSILVLLIPPTSIFHAFPFRVLYMLIICSLCMYIILHCTAIDVAPGFGIGVISSYLMFHMASFLVLNDAKKDFKMLSYEMQPVKGSVTTNDTTTSISLASSKPSPTKKHYFWKPFPTTPFLDRLDWVTDLFINFRGVNWTFKVGGLPSYPLAIQAQLDRSAYEAGKLKDNPVARSGIRRYDTVEACLWRNTKVILWNCVILDIVTTLIHSDPYFWGFPDAKPPTFLPEIVQNNWILARMYRLPVVAFMVYAGLWTVFALAPLAYVGLGNLLSERNPAVKEWLNVRMEPWIYPDYFGPYSAVLDRGLAGAWGSWWHQIFRLSFQEWSRAMCRLFRVKEKGAWGKVLSMFVAFTISGILHAQGSMTMNGDTQPWRNSFLFFAVQPLGLVLEDVVGRVLVSVGVAERCPTWLKKVVRFIWVHIWLFFTAPLFVDDFSRGGLLLAEVFPVSPARFLGLGAPHLSWFTMEHFLKRPPVRWHTDPRGRWWLSGVAF